jgi:DNA polymerase-4/DNA polymerase IV (DinB-like DNA polymerase)
MDQIIIHVDMDAFYASVEIRDDPSLKGRPVIIGSLPHERGVVATCNYEAREYGVHSAMNIKEAYRLCPQGVYLHPNFVKYKAVSQQLHSLWDEYASASENIALDESYLDVTDTAGTFEKAREFAHEIKRRTKEELGLTCSVGLAYCMAAAKTASEEMKPNGYFEIPTPRDFTDLVIDRDVSVLYSVGKKTKEKLHSIEIYTVRDLIDRQDEVVALLGSNGRILLQLAEGIDERRVVPYRPEDAKSISREITFQEDVRDYTLLEDVLLLLSISVADRSKRYGLHGSGVVLKVTYSDMKGITRSKSTRSCDSAVSIHKEAVEMLSALKKRPVRLIGVGVFNLTGGRLRQMTLDEIFGTGISEDSKSLDEALEDLNVRYGFEVSKYIGKLDKGELLHRVAEDMRVHRLYR